MVSHHQPSHLQPKLTATLLLVSLTALSLNAIKTQSPPTVASLAGLAMVKLASIHGAELPTHNTQFLYLEAPV